MRLIKIGCPLEKFRSRFAAERIPADLRRMAGPNHLIDLLGDCRERGSDRDPMVVGRYDRSRLAPPNSWLRCPAAGFQRFQPMEQRLAPHRGATKDTPRV